MSEKMQSWPDSFYATEEFFRSIIYVVVKVQNSWRRRVGNENICIIGNTGIVLWLTVSYAVTLEHRNTIEPQTFDFCSGIAQIMHIVVEALNGGAIKAVIMVAANEYLLRVRKVAEPVQEVQCLLLAAVHGKIAGMDTVLLTVPLFFFQPPLIICISTIWMIFPHNHLYFRCYLHRRISMTIK